jgi:hypothetical protein
MATPIINIRKVRFWRAGNGMANHGEGKLAARQFYHDHRLLKSPEKVRFLRFTNCVRSSGVENMPHQQEILQLGEKEAPA